MLVTGASGFVGRHLVARLLSEGAVVHCLSRQPIARAGWWQADLSDSATLERVLDQVRPRVVFHLAASLARSHSPEDFAEAHRVNTRGALALFEACRTQAPEVLVWTGTSDQYGPHAPPLHEGLPLRPQNPYAASKAALAAWSALYPRVGVPTVEARLFLLYGPGMAPSFFLSQLLASAQSGEPLEMTAGEQTRDFVWVEDAIEALLVLGRRPELAGQAFNVCTGRERSLREVVECLGQLWGRALPVRLGALDYRPGEIFRLGGCPKRLEEATGFKPTVALEEGLGRLVAALRAV